MVLLCCLYGKLMSGLENLNNDDVELFSLAGRDVKCKVVDIYDADTCKVIFLLDNKISKFSVRLTGIDTPEMKPPKSSPTRDAEKRAAKKARNRLCQLVTNVSLQLDTLYKKKEIKELLKENTKLITIKCGKFDKYGRLLGELYVNDTCINQMLIDEKYAYPYDGGTKKAFKV